MILFVNEKSKLLILLYFILSCNGEELGVFTDIYDLSSDNATEILDAQILDREYKKAII
jgi:hypothetical protein